MGASTRAGWVRFVEGALAAVMSTTLASSALASERSEILTARGEVAYHHGRQDEAVRLLRAAVAADARDPLAHNALGQVLLALGRRDEAAAAFSRALGVDPELDAAKVGLARSRGEALAPGADRVGAAVGEIGRLAPVRTEAARKRWGFTITTGVQYDSNVTIEPRGRAASAGLGDQDDAAFVFGLGTRFDLVDRPNLLLRFEYDLYQTLHPDLDEFDFRSHEPRGTASFGLTPELWLGVQGGYNHYTLGEDSYQGEPYVMPFVSYVEGDWGLTQLLYRHGTDTYFSPPFDEERDGNNQTVNLGQTFYFADDRYVTTGYQWNTENPSRSSVIANDWEFVSNQGYLGAGAQLPWDVFADVLYLFRYDDYKHPNSFAAPVVKTRLDH